MDNHFSTYESGDFMMVEVLVEKLDFYGISESSQYLRNILEERHFPTLIFDFSKVAFIDSSVFGFLLEIRSSVQKNGNEMAIVCTNEEVLRVMSMLNVSILIKVFPDIGKARAYLNSLRDM
jgi:anti-anti-sigma factor